MKITKSLLLNTAFTLAEQYGYFKLTRLMIAERCKLSKNLINYHFGSMGNLKKQVLLQAIKYENLAIISQGLMNYEPLILSRTPFNLKQKAKKYMLKEV